MCEKDGDCPGAEVCYQNVSWAEGVFCACSGYYGGTGPDCAELNLQSYVLIAVPSIAALTAILFFVPALWFDLKLVTKDLKWDNTRLTWTFSLFGLLSIVLQAIMVIISAVTPSANKVLLTTQVGGDKLSTTALAERAFLYLSIFFAVSASLNVSLMWIEVVYRTKRLKKTKEGLYYYRRSVRAIQVLWTLVLLTVLFTGLSVLITAIGTFLTAFIAATYFIGRLRFVNLLMESAKSTGDQTDGSNSSKNNKTRIEDPRYAKLLSMIRMVSARVIILLSILVIMLVVQVPISFNWREYSPVGGVSTYAIMLHASGIVLTLVLGTIIMYAHMMLYAKNHGSDSERRIGTSKDEELTKTPSYTFGNSSPNAKDKPRDVSVEESI